MTRPRFAEKSMRVIHTIPRSGTYWINSVLMHYVSDPRICVHSSISKRIGEGILVELAHRYMPPLFGEINVSGWGVSSSDLVEKDYEEQKIVFVYRNPLDQAISFYHHAYLNSFKPSLPLPPAKSEFELLKMFMPCYLRLYLSHVQWKNKFPDNVLMMPYENLKGDSVQNFARIISFLTGSCALPEVNSAVLESTMEKSRAVEKLQKRTMANDLHYSDGVSHMADGRIKKWKEYFTRDQCDWYSSELKLHGIDLDSFDGIK